VVARDRADAYAAGVTQGHRSQLKT
jgi:hypothetical protein